MNVRPVDDALRGAVNEILEREWHCPPSVSRGIVIDTLCLPGFVYIVEGEIQGAITYNITGGECEIVTLNSFRENIGIGTALINAVTEAAREQKCKNLWLVTTNDDINAIRFYQKKGFELIAVRINAIDEVSRKLKPGIPLIGMDNIPIKHELEFGLRLDF